MIGKLDPTELPAGYTLVDLAVDVGRELRALFWSHIASPYPDDSTEAMAETDAWVSTALSDVTAIAEPAGLHYDSEGELRIVCIIHEFDALNPTTHGRLTMGWDWLRPIYEDEPEHDAG